MDPNLTTGQTPTLLRDSPPMARDTLGNPEKFADIPQKPVPAQPAGGLNPVADAGRPQNPRQTPAGEETLEKVLKDVSREVKSVGQKPEHARKPVLIIMLTVVVTVILLAAAFSAFSKN